MISTDGGTGCSRMELEESYPVRGLTSLHVEWEPSYEGSKTHCHKAHLLRPLSHSHELSRTLSHFQNNSLAVQELSRNFLNFLRKDTGGPSEPREGPREPKETVRNSGSRWFWVNCSTSRYYVNFIVFLAGFSRFNRLQLCTTLVLHVYYLLLLVYYLFTTVYYCVYYLLLLCYYCFTTFHYGFITFTNLLQPSPTLSDLLEPSLIFSNFLKLSLNKE